MRYFNKRFFIFLSVICLFICGQSQATTIAIVHSDRLEPVANLLSDSLGADDRYEVSLVSTQELSEQGAAAGANPILVSQLNLLKLRTLPSLNSSDFLIFIEQVGTASTAIIYDLKSNSIIGMLPLPRIHRTPKDGILDVVRDAVLFRMNAFENEDMEGGHILLMPTYIEGADETTRQAFDLLLAARLEAMTGIPVVETERLNRYSKTQLRNLLKTTPEKLIRIRGEITLNQENGARTARFALSEGELATQVYEAAALTDNPKEWTGPICEQLSNANLPSYSTSITTQQLSRHFDCMAQLAFVFRPFRNDKISYAGRYALAAQWLGANEIRLRKILLIEDTNQMTNNRSFPSQPDLDSKPEEPSRENALMRNTLNSIYNSGYDRKIGNAIYWVCFPGSLERAERINENYAAWLDSIKTNELLFEQDLEWEMGYRVLLSLAMPLISSSQGLEHDEYFEQSQWLFPMIDHYYDALSELELPSKYSGSLLTLKTGLLAVENREADTFFRALDKHFKWEQYEHEEHAYLQRGFQLINGISGFFTSSYQWEGLNHFVDSRSSSSSPQDQALCAVFGYYKDPNRAPRLQQLENFYEAIGSIASSDQYSAETINQYMSDFKYLTGIDGQRSISIPDENSERTGSSTGAVWHYEESLRVRLLYQDLKAGLPIHKLNTRKEGGLYGHLARVQTRRIGTGETFTNIDAVRKAVDPFYELLLQFKADTSVSPERIDFLKSFLSPIASSHSDLRMSYSEALDEKSSNSRSPKKPQTLKAKRIWCSQQALSPPGNPEQIRLMSCFIRPSGSYYFARMKERIKVEAETQPRPPKINDARDQAQWALEPRDKIITKIVRIDRETGEFTAVECPDFKGMHYSQIFGWEDTVILLSKGRKGMSYNFKQDTWLPIDIVPNSDNYFQFKDKVYLSHGSTLSRFSLSSNSLVPFSDSMIEDSTPWSAQKLHKFEIEATDANNLVINGFPAEHTGQPPIKLVYDIQHDSWSDIQGSNSSGLRHGSGPYTGSIPYRMRLRGSTFDISTAKRTPGSPLKRTRYQLEFEGLDKLPIFGTVTYEFDSPHLDIISTGIRTSGIWRIKIEEDTYE